MRRFPRRRRQCVSGVCRRKTIIFRNMLMCVDVSQAKTITIRNLLMCAHVSQAKYMEAADEEIAAAQPPMDFRRLSQGILTGDFADYTGKYQPQ